MKKVARVASSAPMTPAQFNKEEKMFKPLNRYLHVKLVEDSTPQTASGILLPDTFNPNEEKYACVEVINVSDDVKFKNQVSEGTKVIVDKSMIDNINFMGKSINVILENYIVGVVNE